MARGTCCVLSLASGHIRGSQGLSVSEGRLGLDPCVIVRLRLNRDRAAHDEVADTAQLFAHDVVSAFLSRIEPQIGYQPWNQVHLHAKLGDSVVVQHVIRAQQRLDRLIHCQMHVRVVNDDIIHTVRVFRVDAKGIGFAHETGVSSAENAISPGVAELPLPLLAEHLIFQGVIRGRYKTRPDKQARGKHGDDSYGRENGQLGFQAGIFRLVNRLVPVPLPELPDAVGQEHITRNEHKAGHPESDIDGEVDGPPICGDISEPPGTGKVKDD